MFSSKIGLLTSFLTSLFLLSPIVTVVNANNLLGKENPPPPEKEKIDQRRTLGSGSRSNCQSTWTKDSLTLLVPDAQVVHQTTKANPSFYFSAQATSTVPLIFNLVIPKPNADNPLVEKKLVLDKPGIQEIKLPDEVKLETGQVYLWQIGVPCSNDPTTIAQVLKAGVKRVPISEELGNQLTEADSPLEKARIYSSNGIWYDALSWAEQDPDSLASTKYIQKLLEEEKINLELSAISINKDLPNYSSR